MGRPGFKPGGWRHASPGGFDSLSPPPRGARPGCCQVRVVMNVAGCEFPEGLWYHVEHQVWARVDEPAGEALVGITSMGIRLAGEIYMCRPKTVGSQLEQGRSVAVVELAKSIVSVKTPVSGTVLAVNEALAARPERVHEDPYGEGWLARIRLSAWPAESAALLRGDDASGALQHMAWLNRLQGELGS